MTAARVMRGDYTPETRAVMIALSPRLVRYLGGSADAAVVLTQVHYWAEYHRAEWFEASSWELADLTGFEPGKVRHLVRKLVDAGHLAKRSTVTTHGAQRCGYRALLDVVNPGEMAPVESDGPPVESDGPGPVESDGPSMVQEQTGNNPPNPPVPGGEVEGPSPTAPTTPPAATPSERSPKLFDDPKVTTMADRRARSTSKLDRAIEAEFEAWWDRYPTDGGSRGSRTAALRAFSRARGRGMDLRTLDDRQGHYRAARARYRAICGTSAPLLNASTFLNSRNADWAAAWIDEDLQYWPAPDGRHWASLLVTSRDMSNDELDDGIPADVRARGVMAVAEWLDARAETAAAGG